MGTASLVRVLVAGVNGFLAAGCGESLEARNMATLDSLFAIVSLVQTAGSAANVAGGGYVVPSGSPKSSECKLEVASVRFGCLSSGLQGITITTYYQLLDAAALPQSSFDPATTSALRVVTNVSGLLNYTVPLTFHAERTLSGLRQGNLVLDGVSNTTQSIPFASFAASETMSGLAIPAAASGKRWPESGQVITDVSKTPGGLSRITMTFNGTTSAAMQIETSQGTTTCSADLNSPGTTRC